MRPNGTTGHPEFMDATFDPDHDNTVPGLPQASTNVAFSDAGSTSPRLPRPIRHIPPCTVADT